MSFSLPKGIRRKGQGSNTSNRPRWQVASSSPTRKPYGASHAQIFPRVDIHTPAGLFTQSNLGSSPSRPLNDHSPTRMASIRRSTPPRPKRDYRQAQWLRWTKEVIPQLVPIFLSVLRLSEDLRNISREPSHCECPGTTRKIWITLVSLQGLSRTAVCSCRPTQLLLRMGYLPSAPLRPTYAFDIEMLDLVRELHLRSPPNKTAWTSTVEAFLTARGYVINGQDVIRRKFTTALRWFTYLRIETELAVHRVVKNPVAVRGIELEEASEEGLEGEWEDEEGDDLLEYLRECCACCFGGDLSGKKDFDPHKDSPVVVVCLDANFTQKRRNPVRGKTHDAPLAHPRSAALSEAEIRGAEEYVEDRRPSRTPAVAKATLSSPDKVEEGMKVPTSVLDGCLDSFTAADEKRTKASTKYFADTGLMALLCRHDRVLWIANMKTAGERQYYAIALILKLFKHLPKTTTVGILYDIGCQLERSCKKWSMITDLLPRIAWGVSVFHAYGHQWPCQLVYHPRKRAGFGLSDGEGCERFWSAIEFLIPTLRVSGYHQRIFTLDVQISFLRKQSLAHLGHWIKRKFLKCREKRLAAIEALGEITYTDEFLETEWEAQVTFQTQPLTRATGGLAKKAVKAILALTEFSSSLAKEIRSIDKKAAHTQSEAGLEDLLDSRTHLEARKKAIDLQISAKRETLGVGDRKNLEALAKDKYLELRMKALAVKERLRAKLQSRKFELERVDRAYQHSANESQLQSHIKTQVGRHAGSITNTLKKYNTLCDEIEGLIRQNKAPPGSISPQRIPQEKLFSLDVDSVIWDDSGLNERGQVAVPHWMGNEAVRGGIVALLEVQRCNEELKRLRQECSNLQQFALREWDGLASAYESSDNDDIKHQLFIEKKKLSSLIMVWKENIRLVSREAWQKSWGPDTGDDGNDARARPPMASSPPERTPEGSDSEVTSSDGGELDLEADDRVLQALESMNLLAEEGGEGSDGGEESEAKEANSDAGDSDAWFSSSPRKRKRL
ncbi:hypothetical protein DFP72DRAFT_990918 [Ephemerocybe angulata]|uniref:CxC1-like cysteine cluster associated with KDZ transposases domain-containing protein n=1 Tax=Ephemerocybe angulata TaxID=980116 RepID=A0A8H6HUY7_9AGAR|nr:hypothetical protein DFP72DRAFT_990918 [Tulosesus angulatus]